LYAHLASIEDLFISGYLNRPTHKINCYHEELRTNLGIESIETIQNATLSGDCQVDDPPTLLSEGAMQKQMLSAFLNTHSTEFTFK
jgi:hypothetical protein